MILTKLLFFLFRRNFFITFRNLFRKIIETYICHRNIFSSSKISLFPACARITSYRSCQLADDLACPFNGLFFFVFASFFFLALTAILLFEGWRFNRCCAHIILKLRAMFGKVKFVLCRRVCVAASLLNLRCLRFMWKDKEKLDPVSLNIALCIIYVCIFLCIC